MEKNKYRVVVLSGKGGTGKTFTAVNLSSVMQDGLYADMDVEEPNGAIFYQPKWQKQIDVCAMVPEYDADKCVACRRCVDFCRFNALGFVGGKVMIFKDICHGCGGCVLVCPSGAMTEGSKPIGVIQSGHADGLKVLSGKLAMGEPSGVHIIEEMSDLIHQEGKNAIIDGPPGTACTVMESVKDADYVVMVAEPTAFGVHNMAMLKILVELYEKPYGVVINKIQSEDNPAEEFCSKHKIPVLARIPFEKTLAKSIAQGDIVTKQDQRYFDLFKSLLTRIEKEMGYETAAGA
ncbi:MAG: ATP-binding protein [Eubacteriales bacterium]